MGGLGETIGLEVGSEVGVGFKVRTTVSVGVGMRVGVGVGKREVLRAKL